MRGEREKNERTAPRWRRRSDARPAEIAEAALELFVARGFAATRMEEIAKRAGVTKGTVYLYFPSKEDLFRAVVHQSVLPGLTLGEKLAAEHEGSASELLGKLIRQWWIFMQDARLTGMPKLVMAEGANFPELTRFYVREVVHRARRLFGGVIERGVAAGEFRRVDVKTAAQLAVAPLWNLAAARRSLRPFDEDAADQETYIELHIDIFLRGLAREGEDSGDA